MKIFHALIAVLTFALIAAAQQTTAIPDNLKPPVGETLVAQVHAEGDQVYACDGAKWTLTGPDAKLFDAGGKQAGRHFAGPTWEWSDGSRVVGRPVANATPDADSVPWLLLTATDHAGSGMLSAVTSIQRVSTKGGKAPLSGCEQQHQGAQTRAHYTADYRFYTRRQ